MKRTFKSILATMLVAATLTTTAPLTIPAAAATTTSTTTTAATTKTTTMYVVKSCYSYKTNSTKAAKVGTYYKGAAIKVTGEKGSFYVLADGSYVKKTNVGSKRINWTDTKYKTTLTRYASKDNVKVRSGALSTSKVVKTLKKGTKLTIVAKTNSGYYKLSDGNYVLATSVTKTKPTTTTTKPTTKSAYDKYINDNDFDTLNLKVYEGNADEVGRGFIYNENDKWVDMCRPNYYDVETGELICTLGTSGSGWYVAHPDKDSSPTTANRFDHGPVYDKLTVGKDIPYGLYNISWSYYSGYDTDEITIKDSKGNIKDTFSGMSSELPYWIYLENGDTITTDLEIEALLTPVINGSQEFAWYGEANGKKVEGMSHYYSYDYVSSCSTVKPGTYKLESMPTADWFHQHWVIVVKNYFKEVQPAVVKTDCIGSDWFTIKKKDQTYVYLDFDPNKRNSYVVVGNTDDGIYGDYKGDYYNDGTGRYLTNTDLLPETITVNEDDFVICYGVRLVHD